MKNNILLKFSALMILFLIYGGVVSAQKFYGLKHSPELVVGKWAAEEGDKSWVLEIKVDTVHIEEANYISETLLGRITFKDQGVVVRQTEFNGYKSIVFGKLRNVNTAGFTYADYEKEAESRVAFSIDADDHSVAYWKLTRSEGFAQLKGWDQKPVTDIPRELVFHKIE